MGEPPVTLQAVHDDGPGNLPVSRIVIHATNPGIGYPQASAAGEALGTARYFQQASSGGSAHYVVDVAGEQHCAPDRDICWHAPPNVHSIGVEICAEGGSAAAAPKSYTREQWLSPAVWPAVLHAAARTAELCARFFIPLAYIGPAALKAGARGICGHADVVAAWHESDHSDPGPAFVWPEFLAAVVAASQEDDVSAADVWATPVDDPYTVKVGDTMSAGTALAWAAAHAGEALDEARAAHASADATLAAVNALTAALKTKGVL